MEQGNPSAHELRDRLVGQSGARPERLPGLLELFESFAAELNRCLSPLLTDSPHCRLNGVEPALLAEALSLIRTPRIAALQACEIDARAFVVFEGAFDWVLIDAVFGSAPGSLGRGQSASKRTRMGERLFLEVASMAAHALGAAFSKICPLPFKLERMLDDKGFLLEGHQAPMIAAKLTIRIKSRECGVVLLMPQSILSQMRSALAEPQTKSNSRQRSRLEPGARSRRRSNPAQSFGRRGGAEIDPGTSRQPYSGPIAPFAGSGRRSGPSGLQRKRALFMPHKPIRRPLRA